MSKANSVTAEALIKLGFWTGKKPDKYYYKEIAAKKFEEYFMFTYQGKSLPINNRVEDIRRLIFGIYGDLVENPVELMPTEEIYKTFWEDIIQNPDGSVNLEQLKKELADYKFILDNVGKVYCHITDNTLSYANYKAEDVIAMADDCFNKTLQEELTDYISKSELEQLQHRVYSITGKGPVMQLFNEVLGISAG